MWSDIEAEAGAAVVTRPRPHVAVLRIASEPLGVLRIAVKRAMRVEFERLEADREIRCVVLTGTGRAFSVGSDVRDFERNTGWLLKAEHEENALNDRIEGSRLPVIAAINGHALGGGAVLALACDLRVAAASARMGVPEVKVGAFASGSGTQRLARLVGRGRALFLLLTGRIIEDPEALQMGLVEQVVPDERLLDAALDLASEIAAMPTDAIEASKRCVNAGLREGWSRGMELEAQYAVSVGLSEAAAEGQRAFIEKRPPRF
jgi:enoyl-CoA hydratase/carnithine racemase